MLIKHRKTGNKGLFYADIDGNILAEMVYSSPAADKMIIEHTEVSEELKGQNVGYQLVQTAVDYARSQHMKITALCPFAHAVLKKKKSEYADVLDKKE